MDSSNPYGWIELARMLNHEAVLKVPASDTDPGEVRMVVAVALCGTATRTLLGLATVATMQHELAARRSIKKPCEPGYAEHLPERGPSDNRSMPKLRSRVEGE